uniref:Uncharacterized protein n=1 Tax=Hyaloperonospora arabidopsidis (strain Emoy2) TaxID=559515 RepID=M4BZX6_HYAAE
MVRSNVVVVTHHVASIETFTTEKTQLLQRTMEESDCYEYTQSKVIDERSLLKQVKEAADGASSIRNCQMKLLTRHHEFRSS